MEGFTIGHNISDSTPTLSSLRLPGRVSTRVSLLFEVQRVSRAVRKQGIGLNRRRRERLFMKAHHYVAPLSFFFCVVAAQPLLAKRARRIIFFSYLYT